MSGDTRTQSIENSMQDYSAESDAGGVQRSWRWMNQPNFQLAERHSGVILETVANHQEFGLR